MSLQFGHITKAHILSVDDSLVIRNQLHRTLSNAEGCEFQLSDSEDGVQALQWLTSCHPRELPDLILLDRNMPFISGDEFIQILRRDPNWQNIPIIFLTTQSEVEDIVRGLSELQADDYLSKPFNEVELIARIKALLRIKEAEQQARKLSQELQKSLEVQKQQYLELMSTKNQLAEAETTARMTSAFERFVPKEFLKRIAPEGIENIRLGQVEWEFITILFADIRAFTTLSEGLSPQELMNFLNSYLMRMNEPISRNHGFVDKFIGDGIMALFGEPGRSIPMQALDGVKAAVEMQLALNQYNEHRASSGHPPIKIGIGLHSGNVVFGTIGSESRMDSTVLGDAVNLASRLESLNKYFKTQVLFSETTFNLLHDQQHSLLMREIDKVAVKGKREAFSVYEAFDGNPPALIEQKLKMRNQYQEGLYYYQQRNFTEALKLFVECQDLCPTDIATAMHLDRCERFAQVPPPENWDGVFHAVDK